MVKQNTLVRSALGLFAMVSALVMIYGCPASSRNPATGPTRATREKLNLIQNQNSRQLSASGVPSTNTAATLNTDGAVIGGGGGTGGGIGGGTGIVGGSPSPSFPFIGAYIQNFTNLAAVSFNATGRISKPRTREGDTNFYYDPWLGLWVQFEYTETDYRTLLFEDEARTKPAGSFISTFTTSNDGTQTYVSTYEITAGLAKGSHGNYRSIYRSNGSGESSYDSFWVDGWRSVGSNRFTAEGEYSWNDRSETPDGLITTSNGTFRPDGSGQTRSTSSDGYIWEFRYNADGSGSGRVEGPAPGLPANIVWDREGNAIVTYADGTVERYSFWFYGFGGGTVSGGTTGGTGGSSSGG